MAAYNNNLVHENNHLSHRDKITAEEFVNYKVNRPTNICPCSNKSDFPIALHFCVIWTDQLNFKFCAIEPKIFPISTRRSTEQTNLHSYRDSAVTAKLNSLTDERSSESQKSVSFDSCAMW